MRYNFWSPKRTCSLGFIAFMCELIKIILIIIFYNFSDHKVIHRCVNNRSYNNF